MKTEAASEVETECMFSSSSKSRDLLLRFSPDKAESANGSDSDEIELGLSLGGCFNSSNHKNRILRTSSIPAILPCEILPLFPLFRSCSLPEEEMQIMARMEGKRKRELEEKGAVLKFRRFEVCGGTPANGVSSPAATLKKGVALEGSNSSGRSELESRSGQGFEFYGFNHGSEIRFMANSEHNNHKAPTFSPFSTTPISKRISNGIVSSSNETLLRKSSGERCMMKEMPSVTTKGDGLNKSMMKEMPLVSTKGDGPNGRRIEGFLYKYGRGEEVRIVCICHGNFLTPAEFVKHAGGGEVAHPLRHIVVNTNPAALL